MLDLLVFQLDLDEIKPKLSLGIFKVSMLNLDKYLRETSAVHCTIFHVEVHMVIGSSGSIVPYGLYCKDSTEGSSKRESVQL